MRINESQLIQIYKEYQNRAKNIQELKLKYIFLKNEIFKINGVNLSSSSNKSTYIDSDHIGLLKSEKLDNLRKIEKEILNRNTLYEILETLPLYSDIEYQKYLFDYLVLNKSIYKESMEYGLDRNTLATQLHAQINKILENNNKLITEIEKYINNIDDPKLNEIITGH